MIYDNKLSENIVNLIPEAVIAVDKSLNIIYANSAAKTMFEIQNKNISLLEATFSKELENAAKKVLEDNLSNEFDIKIYNNGRENFFKALIELTDYPGLIIILNNTSKIKKIDKIRRDFAANVSHELRTPIQLIKGYAETILEQCSLDNGDFDRFKRGIEIILKNAVIMENLTTDLLTLVSLEDENDQKPRPEKTVTNIFDLLTEAINNVKHHSEAKDISVKLKCDKDLCAVLYGPLLIQAVINLLDNAIKYSQPSSKVKVSAEIYMAEKNTYLAIKVKDKGIGIPREYQERIFERFFRVDKARTRDADCKIGTKTAGTGLGLAIVRHIALLHNGKVEVESHAGEGSCFTITIPV